jgi:hypothetical protein
MMEVDIDETNLPAEEAAQEKRTWIHETDENSIRPRGYKETQAEGQKKIKRLKTAGPVVFFFQMSDRGSGRSRTGEESDEV